MAVLRPRETEAPPMYGPQGEVISPVLPVQPTPGRPAGPTFAPPSFFVQPSAKLPDNTSLQDYFQQLLYNQALQYLDPITQRETALWLARDNPEAFAKYSQLQPHTTGGEMGDVASQMGEWLGPPQGLIPGQQQAIDIANQLDFSKMRNSIIQPGGGVVTGTIIEDLGKKENAMAKKDIQAGLGWLQEALRTAAPALSKGGPGGKATRAQQNLSAAHLNTLMQEADREPGRGGMYRTLFENIVNPVTKKTPLTGIFGRSRSLGTQSGQFLRKGVGFRNPGLT